MTFSSLIREAWLSLKGTRIRTFLAMLGIVIGVSSVVVLMMLGAGSQKQIEEAIRSLGINTIVVRPGDAENAPVRNSNSPPLSLEDAEAISQLPSVVVAAPYSDSTEFEVAIEDKVTEGATIGVTPDFFVSEDLTFSSGQGFTAEDNQNMERVALIGSEIAERLSPGEDAVGKIIIVDRRGKSVPFLIVGVLDPRGVSVSGSSRDDRILVPMNSAVRYLFGVEPKYMQGQLAKIVYGIKVKVDSKEAVPATMDRIKALLRKMHNLRNEVSDNFIVIDLAAALETAKKTNESFSLLLGSIASISLAVGGIGIMNIMLVSVTERTREIGIRKAIGGSKKDILMQFLLEAIILTFTGSVLGLLFGWTLGILAWLWGGLPVAYSNEPVLMSLAVSGIVGTLSGFYPAYKAASLMPIEALRNANG
jgi:putative ABC transport system permease protein